MPAMSETVPEDAPCPRVDGHARAHGDARAQKKPLLQRPCRHHLTSNQNPAELTSSTAPSVAHCPTPGLLWYWPPTRGRTTTVHSRGLGGLAPTLRWPCSWSAAAGAVRRRPGRLWTVL